ncbi:hypothetical protein IJM86_07560 [bacterium]|nr:hypothetical protein [bacterium]
MILQYEQKIDSDAEFYDYYDEYDDFEKYDDNDFVMENLVFDDEMIDETEEDENRFATSLLGNLLEDDEYFVNFIPMKKKQRFAEIDA